MLCKELEVEEGLSKKSYKSLGKKVKMAGSHERAWKFTFDLTYIYLSISD
jgi:hypothetical protein